MIPARLTWMVLGMGVTTLTRWKTERSIASASEQLEARLPAPVVRVANALPGDALRVGGAAVVAANAAVTAGRVARGAVGVTGTTIRAGRRVTDAAALAGHAVRARRNEVGATVEDIVDRWRTETDAERRRLRSEMLRVTRGEGAALEASLDLRRDEDAPTPATALPATALPATALPATALPETALPETALPQTPRPVRSGRRRSTPKVTTVVDRVQRTYLPPVKAWDLSVRPSASSGRATVESPRPGQRPSHSG